MLLLFRKSIFKVEDVVVVIVQEVKVERRIFGDHH